MKKITIQILDTDEAEQVMIGHLISARVAHVLRGGIFLVGCPDEYSKSIQVNDWHIPQAAYKILRKTYGKAKSRKP